MAHAKDVFNGCVGVIEYTTCSLLHGMAHAKDVFNGCVGVIEYTTCSNVVVKLLHLLIGA